MLGFVPAARSPHRAFLERHNPHTAGTEERQERQHFCVCNATGLIAIIMNCLECFWCPSGITVRTGQVTLSIFSFLLQLYAQPQTSSTTGLKLQLPTNDRGVSTIPYIHCIFILCGC